MSLNVASRPETFLFSAQSAPTSLSATLRARGIHRACDDVETLHQRHRIAPRRGRLAHGDDGDARSSDVDVECVPRDPGVVSTLYARRDRAHVRRAHARRHSRCDGHRTSRRERHPRVRAHIRQPRLEEDNQGKVFDDEAEGVLGEGFNR